MLSPMAEHIQTTRMRRLPTVFGVFTTFSDEILDVKRFAQVNWWKSLTLEGKCLRWRAKPAHLEGHLPSHYHKQSQELYVYINSQSHSNASLPLWLAAIDAD